MRVRMMARKRMTLTEALLYDLKVFINGVQMHGRKGYERGTLIHRSTLRLGGSKCTLTRSRKKGW